MARPKAELVLSDAERETLVRWSRRAKSAQALALRCRVVLACAGEKPNAGKTNTQVAEELGVTLPTVGKWRRRFIEHRLEGLHDEARSGAPRKITDEQVEQVVVKTLESLPKNATHWSTRTMANATGLSQSAIVRIWHAFALQPHRTGTFKLSADPLFIEKVRDIVGLYLAPPERAIVLSLDEKSQIQALDRTQPGLPLGLGYTEKHTHDYVRHGTTSLFSALNVATGEVIGQCLKRHRHQEFLKFLKTVDAAIPDEEGHHPRDHGQLRNPQNTRGSTLVCEAPAIPRPLHAHECLMAEPGGTVFRRNHDQEDSSGNIPKREATDPIH